MGVMDFDKWWKETWEDKEIPDDNWRSGISTYEIAKSAWEAGVRDHANP